MAQCPNCGRTTTPGLTTCTACGTTLPEAVPPQARPPEASAQIDPPPARPTDPPPRGDRSPAAPPSEPPSAEEQRAAEAAARRAQMASWGGPKASLPAPRRSALRAALPAISALVLGLALQWVISSLVPADSYVHRLFRPAGGWIMSLVPGLIAFVFIWTITDLFLKYRVGRANDRDLSRPEVTQLPISVGQEPLEMTLQRLRGWDQRMLGRPVGRRVVWLLRHLSAMSDPQRMHELLRHQSDLDADAAASGYRTATLFIWAMPILGFIGTVLGISLAVGGFSEFLTTSVSIDEIDSVTQELGNVASGLSFAFDTTLLGLLAGLVASAMSSAVKEREERVLTTIDELGLRIMEHATSTDEPQREAASVGQSSEIAHVYARLEELSSQMRMFSQAMKSGLDGLNDASAKMSDGMAASIASVRGTVEQLGQSLQGVSQTLAASVSGLGEKVTASEGEVRQSLSNLQQTNQRLEAALASTAEKVAEAAATLDQGARSQAAAERAMEQLSGSIADFGARVSEFTRAQDAIAPALARLAGPLELRLTPSPGNAPASD